MCSTASLKRPHLGVRGGEDRFRPQNEKAVFGYLPGSTRMCRLRCTTSLGQNLPHATRCDPGQLADLAGGDALIRQGQHELATQGKELGLGRDPHHAREVLLDRTDHFRRQHDLGVRIKEGPSIVVLAATAATFIRW